MLKKVTHEPILCETFQHEANSFPFYQILFYIYKYKTKTVIYLEMCAVLSLIL